MVPIWRRATIRKRGRATVSLVLVVIMCAGGVGVPLLPFVEKDLSQPFPCQSCACACRNADSCWNACCCHTDAEKLAWAAEHGVKAPAFVRARVNASRPQAVCDEPEESADACCHAEVTPVLGDDQEDSKLHVVLLSAQNRCQGFSAWMSLMSSALLELPKARWELQTQPAESVRTVTPRYESPWREPPVPPPKVANSHLSTRPCAA